MSASAVPLPYPVFSDLDGSPLSGGYLYFGTAGLNPETNPVSVYIDAAMTTPIAQPIRTLNGYPSYNGSPTNLYINSDFSLTVKNNSKSLVFTKPNNTTLTSASFVSADDSSSGSLFTTVQGFITKILSSSGASIVGFIQAGTGAIARSAQGKMREGFSFADFGAFGDGVVDETASIQLALNAATDGQWIDGENKTYKITSQINGTNQIVRLRNAKFVFSSSYATQGCFSLNAGAGTTAMTVELENISVDGGRGGYKVGNEPWEVFTTFAGYESIRPTLSAVFRVDSYNSDTVVNIRNVNFKNIHADACVLVNTYGTVFIDDCLYTNISNKTFHVYHSPDDGVTQSGRTLANNVYAKDVGIMPAAFTVSGASKVRSDPYAPQGSFNFIVSHGDYTLNNAIVWNYASCGVTADRNRAFSSNNVFIYHDSPYGFSNNPSGAFWIESVKRASFSNLTIDIQSRDARDTALDSCALQIYQVADQQLCSSNIIIRGNTASAKVRKAVRGSVSGACASTINSFFINGLYADYAINFGQLSWSVIGNEVRLNNGQIISGGINADQPKLLDINGVKMTGNVTVSTSGNPGITGSVDDVSVSNSVFNDFTNTTTITRSLRISDNDALATVSANDVAGQFIMDGNQIVNGSVSVNSTTARVGIHDNAKITGSTIAVNAKDFRFTGNNTDRRVEVRDVQTFTIVGNTIKTDAGESIAWVNPVTAGNVLAGVIGCNNILIKTATVGAAYVTIAGGVVGVTDVNNNKLTVSWS